ncbi:MAG: glycoside hydrolase family 3 protein [Treponema sp.]|jgi:beta-N-acetylhexosaminidase|nr:glycoside hydrolase family 3 protein [Treponema sp.]
MRLFAAALIIAVVLVLFSVCSGKSKTADEADRGGVRSALGDAEAGAPDAAFAAERKRAARIAASLDDRLLAAQVTLCGIDGRGSLQPDMRGLLEECPAGGIILFRYNLDTDNESIRSLIQECADLIASESLGGVEPEGETAWRGILPFVAVDHEGGSVNRFKSGVADLPPAGGYWELAQQEGRDRAVARIEADSFISGLAIKDMGFNLNLAPVAERLNDGNRDFLDDRLYGPDTVFTAEAAAAFIRGMERAGILCAIKHFPGSAGPDPHRFPSILRGDRAALDELTAPFAALIRGGQARALVAAHSAIPARDLERIASLSAPVMDGWLRNELGFEGIIISDDFSMAAAGTFTAAADKAAGAGPPLSTEAAAVLSLAAGADMVLVWPPDIRRTHRAIRAALSEGALSRERLREAAARIIFEKIRMGLLDEQ